MGPLSPPPTPLPGPDAFPLRTWLTKPYCRRNLTNKERMLVRNEDFQRLPGVWRQGQNLNVNFQPAVAIQQQMQQQK